MSDVYADIFTEARVLQEQAPEYNIKSSIMFQSMVGEDASIARTRISEFGKTTGLNRETKLVKQAGDTSGVRTGNSNEASSKRQLESGRELPYQKVGDGRSPQRQEPDLQAPGNPQPVFTTMSFQKQPQMGKVVENDSRLAIENQFQNKTNNSDSSKFEKKRKYPSPVKVKVEDDPQFLAMEVTPVVNRPSQNNPFVSEFTPNTQVVKTQPTDKQESDNEKWKNFTFTQPK